MKNCTPTSFGMDDGYVEVTYKNEVYSLQLPDSPDSQHAGPGYNEIDGDLFQVLKNYVYSFYTFKDDDGDDYIDHDMAAIAFSSGIKTPIYTSMFVFFGSGDYGDDVYIVMDKNDLNHVVYLTLSSYSDYYNITLYEQADSDIFDDMTAESESDFKEAHEELIAELS